MAKAAKLADLPNPGYELIIAEKPQAALRIAASVLEPGFDRKSLGNVWYFAGRRGDKKIVIASAVGHLFGLAEKNKSGWRYPVFELEWRPTFEISKQAAHAKKFMQTLKRLASGATSFVNACDLDTEGELIFRNILRFVCGKEDAARMRFSTLTAQELREAYERAAPHIDFGLAEAGETRHWLDYLWGVNTTRALTLSMKSVAGGFQILSSGRVQSPTLAILAKREREIGAFVPKPFWQLRAKMLLEDRPINFLHAKEKFWKEQEAQKTQAKCAGKDAKVVAIKSRDYKVPPPVPFNITTLQAAAYDAFGFTPSQTLEIAESLYLAAYISYPRTASEKLPAQIGLREIIQALAQLSEFRGPASRVLGGDIRPKEGKRTDPAHVAIYPTASPPKSLDVLEERQRKLYSLIVARFLACFSQPAMRQSMEVRAAIGDEIFFTKGVRVVDAGWTAFYPYLSFKEEVLPELTEGQTLKVGALEISRDATKPPNRYSPASIVLEMEKRGLGTKATRADILQTLYDRRYVTERPIQVTDLGRAIVDVLDVHVPELLSERLSRHFEREMEKVQLGKKEKERIITEAKALLAKTLQKFKVHETEIGKGLLTAYRLTRTAESIIGECSNCRGELRIIRSRTSGKIFIGCSGYSKGCRMSYPLPQTGKIKPTKQSCKACDSPIVFVYTKGRRPWRLCINPSCQSKKERAEKTGSAEISEKTGD